MQKPIIILTTIYNQQIDHIKFLTNFTNLTPKQQYIPPLKFFFNAYSNIAKKWCPKLNIDKQEHTIA